MNWSPAAFMYRLDKRKNLIYRVCAVETFTGTWNVCYSLGGEFHPDNWVSWVAIRSRHRLWNGKPLIRI